MRLLLYGFIGYWLYTKISDSECKPEELIKKWLAAVKSGSVSRVMEMYSPNALLLPTFGHPKKGNELKAYFERFLAKQNLEGKVISLHSKSDGKLCVASGEYIFTYSENGTQKSVPARYTFVFEHLPLVGWKIIQHQSSVDPSQ